MPWEIITDRGRWLRGVQVRFEGGVLHVAWVRLEPGERIAILLDRQTDQVRLYAPLDECQELALRHGYELVMPRKERESFVEHIEKFLGLLNAAPAKGASRRAGHDGHGGVADTGEMPLAGGVSPAPCTLNPAPRPGAGTEAARQGAQGAGE
jgi:hypothetical protein